MKYESPLDDPEILVRMMTKMELLIQNQHLCVSQAACEIRKEYNLPPESPLICNLIHAFMKKHRESPQYRRFKI